MESQKEYVSRMLQSPVFNHSEVARQAKISRDTLKRFEKNLADNPNSRTVEVLFNFFKLVSL